MKILVSKRNAGKMSPGGKFRDLVLSWKAMAYSYLLWLFLFAVLPLVCLWAVYIDVLRRYWRAIFLAPIGSLIFSFPWDYISIHEHIWYFQTPHIAGFWMFGLPIEEYLFIVLITLLFASIAAVVWSRLGVPE
jgi:lycopene cyclase domain-containing protein